MWMDGYKKAYAYVMKEREKAPICTVCRKKLFDYNNALDDYFHKHGIRDIEDARKIYRHMFENYPFNNDDTGFRTKHHVNYMLDITIDVCSSCHSKIHNSPDKKYKKYKPYDNKSYSYR